MIGYPNLACPAEPTDCSTIVLGINSRSVCFESWEKRKSEVNRVWLAPYTGDLTPPIAHADMEDLTAWEALISESVVVAPYIREYYVSAGDMPIPEKATVTHKGIAYPVIKNFTVNYDLLDLKQVNYDMSRGLENNKSVWMAFDTDGGSLYGWMLVNVDNDLILNRGDDSYETIQFSAKWKATCKPPRYDSPFAN